MAIALFGNGSFLHERVDHLNAIRNLTAPTTCSSPDCKDLMPMQRLLGNDYIVDSIPDLGIVDQQIYTYIYSFAYYSSSGGDGERIKNAYTAAAFLTNEIWLTTPSNPVSQLSISYDLGTDTRVPVISTTGIATVSALLGLFLLSLFVMAIYSVRISRWTKSLDAFAMMRIGASLSPDLKMHLVPTVSEMEQLDDKPGWVGDVSGGEGEIGTLGLGATSLLRRGRKYR